MIVVVRALALLVPGVSGRSSCFIKCFKMSLSATFFNPIPGNFIEHSYILTSNAVKITKFGRYRSGGMRIIYAPLSSLLSTIPT